MFEISSQSTATCLVVHFSGKVTGEDYQQFLKEVDERLQSGAEVNLVLSLIGFEFYGDLEAAKSDFKFGFGEYKHFHRAAYVGDQRWIVWFARLIGPFTHAEEKLFPSDKIADALDWACA